MVTEVEYNKEIQSIIKWIHTQDNVAEIIEFFNSTPPVDKGYMFWKHPIITQIKTGLCDKGYSMGWFNILMYEVKDKFNINPNDS